jgi:hypothetical protein
MAARKLASYTENTGQRHQKWETMGQKLLALAVAVL